MEGKTFLTKPKHQFIYPNKENEFMVPIMKKKRLLCEFMFVLINRITLILKNDGKKSFSNATKASMSFIPKKKMCLWCPIIKGKVIIMCIYVYPN